jgi:hypothetical protein
VLFLSSYSSRGGRRRLLLRASLLSSKDLHWIHACLLVSAWRRGPARGLSSCFEEDAGKWNLPTRYHKPGRP